jgi:cobalt-zinc-cadmium efflux system outer membrane protein
MPARESLLKARQSSIAPSLHTVPTMQRHTLALLLLLLPAAALAAQDFPLTLAEALRRAAEHNRDVLTAQRQIEAAAADQLSAGQTPPTQLSINSTQIDPSRFGGGPWSKQVDSVFRIDKPIERGNKLKLRVAAADAAYAAAHADADDMLRQQRLAISNVYWDVKLARAQLDIAQDSQRVGEEARLAATRQLKAGALSRIEADRLGVEAQRAANDVASASAQLSRARLALATLLADEANAESLDAVDAWPNIDVVPAIDPNTALQRPDVQAARQRVELAIQAFQQARAQGVADITVGVQYEHFPPDARNTIGIGLSIPLFLAERQTGAIKRAGVARADAEAALERTSAQARSDLMQARRDAETARARLQRYERDLLPQARQVVSATVFARAHGAMNLQDLLDARRTLYAVRQEAEQAHADLAKALGALRLAGGQTDESKPSLSANQL